MVPFEYEGGGYAENTKLLPLGANEPLPTLLVTCPLDSKVTY